MVIPECVSICVSLFLVPFLRFLFRLLICIIMISFCFTVSYIVLSRNLCSLMRQKGGGFGWEGVWEELGGVEKGETIIRIIMREKIHCL